jgi:hypothetical protein
MKPLEELVKRGAPDDVGNVRSATSLEGVRLEEASIQKGNCSELNGQAASIRPGTVQGAEEKRPQEIAMDSPPPRDAAIDLLCQELFATGEPAFGLNEVQEEDPGELQQSEAVAVAALHPTGQLFCHVLQGGPELPEEAASDRLGRKCIRRPSGKGHWSSARAAGQPGKRAYNLRIWIEKVQLQMRETIKGRGNCEPASGTIQGKHDCRLTPSADPTS